MKFHSARLVVPCSLAMLGAVLAAMSASGCRETSAEEGVRGPGDDGRPKPVEPIRACNASAAAGIEVTAGDVNGFPPYAVSACTLVYVSATGDLLERDLASGAETTLAPAREHPRRPAASSELVAWEADEDGHSVVRVRSGGQSRTVPGAFAAAGEPRVSGGAVAFTVWHSPSPLSDTDVWLYETTTGEARVVIGGPGQQRFADVSSTHVAATDFSEDPDGRHDDNGTDLADIVLFVRETGAVIHRPQEGKQSFPMLASGDVLAYLDWAAIHPEPKLQAYAVRSGSLRSDPSADRTIAAVSFTESNYARPAVAGAMMEWISTPRGLTTLYRAPVDGSSPPTVVEGLPTLWYYAPASTSLGTTDASGGFTLIATSARNGTDAVVPRLLTVPR